MESRGINLSGIDAPVFVKALSKSAEGGLGLKMGDVIQARVVAFSNGNGVLNIGGVRIPVSTGLTLNPGDSILLMVAEMRPDRLVLKWLGEPNSGLPAARYTRDELIGHLLKNTGLKGHELQGVADILKGGQVDIGRGLVELMKSLIGLKEGGKDVANLGKLLISLGEVVVEAGDKAQIESAVRAMVKAVSHEANCLRYLQSDKIDLENLKMRLLESRFLLQGAPQSASGSALSELKSPIEKVLNLLNSIEVLNLPVDSKAKEFIYLPLPVRVGENIQTAEIRIYSKEPEGETKSKSHSFFTIVFALDMPSLGKTRAVLEIVDKFINFSILIENRAFLVEAESLFGELRDSLEALGYTVGNMSAGELKEEVIKNLIEEKVGIKPEGIDFRA